MIKTITSFNSVEPQVLQVIDQFQNGNQKLGLELLESQVLIHKVKFPILERVALRLNQELDRNQMDHLPAQLGELRHISCYPIIGKLVQLRIDEDLQAAYTTAIEHIIKGDEWYVCDIISERVFGEGTLRHFDQSYPLLSEMGNHPNLWIQRSIGIATHYATKKELLKPEVEQLFLLMLQHGYKTQLYIKKGIGWAAKTTAKYHPDLIHAQANRIEKTQLSKWFRRKINIGLSMAKAELLPL